MLSIYNMLAVARYEMKTLFRSWFFRIFAVLALVFINLMNAGFISQKVPWNFKAIASTFPYYNILFLNTVQAIIAVFLASDFLKRDKKLDTTEVVYMRSMTNGDYVLGKTIGILTVFMLFNLAHLTITLIFNIISTDIAVNIAAYFIYPILISIPTLIFIFGLSFLLMTVIRNQAITFILLLGYIAVTLFWLGNKYYHIFDYMAYHLPLTISDFVGFGNLTEILMHRMIYLLLGIGCIFGTIKLLKRLPQSNTMQGVSTVICIISIIAGLFLGGKYIAQKRSFFSYRKEAMDLNDKYANDLRISPESMNIDLDHSGKSIQCKVEAVYVNNNDDPVDSYIFNLNPALKIDKISSGGKTLTYDRKIHLVIVKPGSALQPGESEALTFIYKGGINEDISYLDATREMLERQFKIFVFNIDKRSSFITPDYLLLTRESLWYPQPGVTYSPGNPRNFNRFFTNYKLKVKTKPGLMAVSQGSAEKISDGEFLFETEVPLPKISIIAGNYEKKSIAVDSIEYSIYSLEGHDYYSQSFDLIADTLDQVIRENKQDFENKLGLQYGYSKFSLVEVPVQFQAYNRIQTLAVETVQPQIVLLPERGIGVEGLNFSNAKHWMKREQKEMQITDVEIQIRLFKRFLKNTLFSKNERWRGGDGSTFSTSYTIFPNYFSYMTFLESDKWPLFNNAFGSYLSVRIEGGSSQFKRIFAGITDEEKVNLALIDKTMDEILSDAKDRALALNLIKQKGNYLFLLMKSQIGKDEFTKDLNILITDNKFRSLSGADFIDYFINKYNINFEENINKWQQSTELPAFLITDVKGYSLLDGNRMRYQIKFTLINKSSTSGLIKVVLRLGGRGRGDKEWGRGRGMGGDDSDIEELIPMESNQCKEVGIMLDGQPRMLEINTMISKNFPSVITKPFKKFEQLKNIRPFEGVKVLDEMPRLTEPGVIIIDNENEGFETVENYKESPLVKLFDINKEPEQKYSGMRWWNLPKKWTAITASEFYGDHVKSAEYIKAGVGENKACWNAAIPAQGRYDLYFHHIDARSPWEKREGGKQRGKYSFIVHSADGEEEAILGLSTADKGWNFLGSYYLPEDRVKVELSDKVTGDAEQVVADAIKWVKQ